MIFRDFVIQISHIVCRNALWSELKRKWANGIFSGDIILVTAIKHVVHFREKRVSLTF
jgi:hypothetical protein